MFCRSLFYPFPLYISFFPCSLCSPLHSAHLLCFRFFPFAKDESLGSSDQGEKWEYLMKFEFLVLRYFPLPMLLMTHCSSRNTNHCLFTVPLFPDLIFPGFLSYLHFLLVYHIFRSMDACVTSFIYIFSVIQLGFNYQIITIASTVRFTNELTRKIHNHVLSQFSIRFFKDIFLVVLWRNDNFLIYVSLLWRRRIVFSYKDRMHRYKRAIALIICLCSGFQTTATIQTLSSSSIDSYILRTVVKWVSFIFLSKRTVHWRQLLFEMSQSSTAWLYSLHPFLLLLLHIFTTKKYFLFPNDVLFFFQYLYWKKRCDVSSFSWISFRFPFLGLIRNAFLDYNPIQFRSIFEIFVVKRK